MTCFNYSDLTINELARVRCFLRGSYYGHSPSSVSSLFESENYFTYEWRNHFVLEAKEAWTTCMEWRENSGKGDAYQLPWIAVKLIGKDTKRLQRDKEILERVLNGEIK